MTNHGKGPQKLISHRGNIRGRNPGLENWPGYIVSALREGYDVEIDVWEVDGNIYLGHDRPIYEVACTFLTIPGLWCHFKTPSLCERFEGDTHMNYFVHDSEDSVLTSRGYRIYHPKALQSEITSKAVAMCPEQRNDKVLDLAGFYGICSDNIIEYG
jgi:hypothetical protein|tara:strand:- start:14417 stop:14887 length:471 start_codon:yes stop_codon:yes gene_type:complete